MHQFKLYTRLKAIHLKKRGGHIPFVVKTVMSFSMLVIYTSVFNVLAHKSSLYFANKNSFINNGLFFYYCL
jgi:hypothetical protein